MSISDYIEPLRPALQALHLRHPDPAKPMEALAAVNTDAPLPDAGHIPPTMPPVDKAPEPEVKTDNFLAKREHKTAPQIVTDCCRIFVRVTMPDGQEVHEVKLISTVELSESRIPPLTQITKKLAEVTENVTRVLQENFSHAG